MCIYIDTSIYIYLYVCIVVSISICSYLNLHFTFTVYKTPIHRIAGHLVLTIFSRCAEANDEPLHLMAGSFGIGNAKNNTDPNSVLPRNNKTHTPIFELYSLGSSCLSMPSCSKEFILKHSKPKMSKTPHEPSQ